MLGLWLLLGLTPDRDANRRQSSIIPIVDRPIAATTATLQLTAQAAAYTTTTLIKQVDLTGYSEFRLSARVATGSGVATAKIGVEGSTDGSTWTHLDGTTAGAFTGAPSLSLTTTASVVSSWYSISPALTGDIVMRLVHGEGNGVATPAVNHLWVEVR